MNRFGLIKSNKSDLTEEVGNYQFNKDAHMNLLKTWFFEALDLWETLLSKVTLWIVQSSKNPDKLSMTLKYGVPFLVLFKVGDVDSLGVILDSVVNFTVMLGTWITGTLAVWGAGRKVFSTVYALIKEKLLY